jgi:hypothetical protein
MQCPLAWRVYRDGKCFKYDLLSRKSFFKAEQNSRNDDPVFSRFCSNTKSDYQLRFVCPSAWHNSALTGRFFFIKFDIQVFFENLSKKFKFH